MFHVSMDSHRLPNGSVNWPAYEAVQQANGETCRECRAYLDIGNWGRGPARCGACETLDKESGEVDHANRVRCPDCGHVQKFDPGGRDTDCLAEGDWEIECRECGRCYDVKISVSISFNVVSPARTPAAEPEPERAEGDGE